MAPRHPATRDASCGAPLLVGALVASVVPLFPPAAIAQEGPTASLGGVIVEAETGRPLAGASVTLLGIAGRDVTDAEGRFILYDVPAGRQRILVAYRGHEAPERPIRLAAERHTDVRIALAVSADLEPRDEDVVPLPPLGVEIDGSAPAGKLRPFHERREVGRGSYITQDEIVERDPSQMTDMLREVAGIRVSGSSSFGSAVSTVRGCGLEVFIDGMPAPGFRVDDMPPQDVAGVEIYLGPSETPVQFRHSGECGALIIWTRDPNDPA